MGEHADDAFDEILDRMDFTDQCRDAGIDPDQESAADALANWNDDERFGGDGFDGQRPARMDW